MEGPWLSVCFPMSTQSTRLARKEIPLRMRKGIGGEKEPHGEGWGREEGEGMRSIFSILR